MRRHCPRKNMRVDVAVHLLSRKRCGGLVSAISSMACMARSAKRADSTKIVGVGLDLEPHGGCRNEVIIEPVSVAVGDRCFLRGEGDSHLSVGISRAVPAGQRIGVKRLLPLELEDPLTGIRFAGLRGFAFLLHDTGDRHGLGGGKDRSPNQAQRLARGSAYLA